MQLLVQKKGDKIGISLHIFKCSLWNCFLLPTAWQIVFCINNDDDSSILETYIKGLEDHCTPRTPLLESEIQTESDMATDWLIQLKILPDLGVYILSVCCKESFRLVTVLFTSLDSSAIVFS